MSLDFVTGERVVVEVTFRVGGVAFDPTLVQCYARQPSGSLAVYPYGPGQDVVTRLDVGLYEAALIVDVPGSWAFRFEGAGVGDAVAEQIVIVRPSAVLDVASSTTTTED